ncbi:broad-complex core protein isoforms 1/2/3/4/5 isoform X17 [Cherax quadricarinatus]|uniref:broad-complex core protein isoforms 1/2/3/4/5 isoform X17 n=1 Tax=Cherax quadricarinatus TaxID=27406 RepID=UPI002379D28E|nr:broad-complex core protein isoforms 1/2/3/4/5-like isoform X6 [Cherax quadricarinatus]
MAEGMLSLSWNNHRATFCHILSTLREKERYTDVTVACDGKFYQVHKLVLSTCSEYFEKIFENTPCKHPVIVLKDVQTDELEALLSYMYEGAVSVAQNDLARLIKAAEVLRIKGLAVPDEPPLSESCSKRVTQSRNASDDRSSPHPKRRRREESNTSLQGAQTSTSPPASPRVSSFESEGETHHSTSRTQSDSRWMDQRSSEREDQSTDHPLDDRLGDHTATSRSSPTPPQVEVMVDETLVKEEMVDHVDNSQDDIVDSGMDYGSMGSDSRLDGSGGGEEDPSSQMLPNKFEPKINPSQGQAQQLPDAVVEALAGPSGMQGWLSGCEMPTGFSGLEGYSGGDGSQDVHPPPQGQPVSQSQAHQLVLLESVGQQTGETDASGTSQQHAVPKILRCCQCSYTTTNTSHFKRHNYKHTGEKPFSCSYCSFSCNQKTNLYVHIRRHTGEKPYACMYCTFRATHKSNLKTHMFKMHRKYDHTKLFFL